MVTRGVVVVNHHVRPGADRVPAMGLDPFDALGLPARFELPFSALERAYLARSAGAHPDATASDVDSNRISACLNESRQILENPESRAEALLARLGGPSKEADRSLPSGFLAQIMEVREAVEAARAAGDRTALAAHERWAQQQRDQHIRSVGELFGALRDRPSEPQLRAIRTELNAWRYVERMIEQLDPDFSLGHQL
jgi:molecular chaperone HscB